MHGGTDGSELRESDGGKRDSAANRRDASSERRDFESDLRDGAANARDTLATDRDEAADLRDRAADDRDAAAARTRTLESRTESAPEAVMRQNATADRHWSSEGRDAAESEREHALGDREHASDTRNASMVSRGESASDRDSSAADRLASARERASAAMDALTGAYLRGPGIAELEREIERADRTSTPLVLVFLDVDHLKNVNDTGGHPAGDRLLQAVVKVLQEQLRPYDRIVRYGGDEFVCALSNMTEADALLRFKNINAALSAATESGSVTFGLATMVAGDSVASLIARADTELYRKRGEK